MKHMKIGEVGTLIGREWKALSAEQKKVVLSFFFFCFTNRLLIGIQTYEDRAAKDKLRYNEEFTTVYGTAPLYMKKASKKAT